MLLTVALNGQINLVRSSAEGTRLVVAPDWQEQEGGAEVVVLEVPSGKEVARYGGLRAVRDAVFRSPEELIVCHGPECWRYGPRKKPRRLVGEEDLGDPGGDTNNVTLSPDGKTLAVGTESAVLLVDLARQRIRARLPTPTAATVTATAFSPDGRYLAAGACTRDYTYLAFIPVWDLRQERLVQLLKLDSVNEVNALAFHPDNRLLAVSTGHWGGIDLFDLQSKQHLPERLDRLLPRTYSSERDLMYGMGWSEPVSTHAEVVDVVESLRFSADGRVLKVVGSSGAAVRLYPRSGRILSRRAPPEGHHLLGARVSQSGTAAAIAGPYSVLLWDVLHWGDG